jgi:hypothetical protein
MSNIRKLFSNYEYPLLTLEEYNLQGNITLLRDEKVIGTNGGTFIKNIWKTRDLNTIITSSGSGISLSNNQITLQPGTYIIDASCPSYKVDYNAIRLNNITYSTIDICGTSSYSKDSLTTSKLYSILNVPSETVYELQHISKKTQNFNGLGLSTGFQTEVYSIVKIIKLK